jgi:hypothetical protein
MVPVTSAMPDLRVVDSLESVFSRLLQPRLMIRIWLNTRSEMVLSSPPKSYAVHSCSLDTVCPSRAGLAECFHESWFRNVNGIRWMPRAITASKRLRVPCSKTASNMQAFLIAVRVQSRVVATLPLPFLT